MNRALLADLQGQQAYPSITLLMNTSPGAPLSHTEIATARHLAEDAARRLDGDVSAELRAAGNTTTESVASIAAAASLATEFRPACRGDG